MSADACLTPEERAHAIRLLEETADEFLNLISGLNGEQWTRKPITDGWPVQQIAEHMVLAEKAMFAKVQEALASPPHVDWVTVAARKTAYIGRVLPDRKQKAAAPSGLEPHRGWSIEETVAHFRAGRARTLEFARKTDRPLKGHISRHPFPLFDLLNAHQWLLYIPLHNVRHNRQIAEVLQV